MTALSLFARCQSGGTDARNELLRMHVGIVHFVARRLARSLADEADLGELVSAGHIGLMAAVAHFDEARGLAFTTFAATRVRGAILDELRRQDRVPRSVRAKARTLHAVRDKLGNALGRTPSHREVALAAALPLDTLWQWQRDIDRAGQLPLDAPVGTDDGEGRTLGERVEEQSVSPSMRLEREETRDLIRASLDELGETERRVVSLYFFEEKTLQEIAPHLGVSESRVSQIRTRALRRLRERLTSRGLGRREAFQRRELRRCAHVVERAARTRDAQRDTPRLGAHRRLHTLGPRTAGHRGQQTDARPQRIRRQQPHRLGVGRFVHHQHRRAHRASASAASSSISCATCATIATASGPPRKRSSVLRR